jgi:hypothetical protein
MQFAADRDKTKFDIYFAPNIADILTDAAEQAQRVELDKFTVEQVLAYLARRFRLEVTP